METLTAIWAFLSQFPVGLAQETTGIVLGANGIFAILVIAKRGKLVITPPVQWAPMMLFAVAWLVGWVAGLLGSGIADWFWVTFSVLTLTSFVWSVINIIRALANR